MLNSSVTLVNLAAPLLPGSPPRPGSGELDRRRMATYLIPLHDILTAPDRPLDLTALPATEAVERIKQTYGYWGPLLDVRIEGGIAVITLPDENASKAGTAIPKTPGPT